MLEGWARCEQGEGDAGLALVKQGFAEFLDTGALMDRPRWLSVLAETHAACRRPQAGLQAVEQGLSVARRSGERFYEARLLGLRGDLLIMGDEAGAQAEAQDCYLRSLELARWQGAKDWELRTAIRLAKLWAQQGKVREGLELLAPVYGWFREGIDTPDLRDAKAFLDAVR